MLRGGLNLLIFILKNRILGTKIWLVLGLVLFMTSVCACVSATSAIISQSHSLLLFFEAGALIDLELTKEAKYASQ